MKITKLGLHVLCFVLLVMGVFSLSADGQAQTPPILKQYTANLVWVGNTEDDLDGYRVYRGQGAAVCNDAATPLPPLVKADQTQVVLGKTDTTYSDVNIPNVDGLICYELTAFDVAQNESGRSNRAIGLINANPPSAPRNLGLTVVVK